MQAITIGGVMRKAKVLGINKYEDYPRTGKKKRIILEVEYDSRIFYLDVTDELENYGVVYEFSIDRLRDSLPEYIEASFFDIVFKISKISMKHWINNLLTY